MTDEGGGINGDGFVKGLESHLGSLQRYALLLTRNRVEADDLVQDCLTKAIASAGQWQPGTDLRAWLFRILYTCHVSDRRKWQVRARYAEQVMAPDSVDAEQMIRVESRQVLTALDGLPEQQREAILVIALDESLRPSACSSWDGEPRMPAIIGCCPLYRAMRAKRSPIMKSSPRTGRPP